MRSPLLPFRIGSVLATLLLPLSGAKADSPPSSVALRLTWNWTQTSPLPNSRSIALGGPLDDKRHEVLVVGSPRTDSTLVDGGYWFALEERQGGFDQRWSSLGMEPGPRGLYYVDGPEPTIVVWTAAAAEVYDSATKRHLRSIALDSPPYVDSINDLAVADVDGLGGLELLTINDHDLFVYDFESGALVTIRSGFGGYRFDVGQADDDPALEVVLSGNSLGGYLLDGSSWHVQWGLLAGFGWEAWLLDIDGDSRCEVITNEPSALEAWNPRSGSRIWSRADLFLLDLEVGRLSSSGASIVGHSYSTDSISVLRAVDGADLWSVAIGDVDDVELALGELDGDQATEIVVAMTGWRPMLTIDSDSHLIEAEAEKFRGPFPGLSAADFDLDGRFDLIANGILEGETQDGWIPIQFDVASKRLVPTGLPEAGVGGNPVGSAVLQTDGDPQPEICVPVRGDNGLVCLDGASRQVDFEVPYPHESTPLAQFAFDITGDPRLELIVVTWGGFIHAYGGDPFSEIWISSKYTVHRDHPLIRVGDVDGDSDLEVVVGGVGLGAGVLTLLDAATGVLEVGPFEVWASALEIVDQGPLLPDLVLVGTADGSVSALDLSTGTLLPPIATFEGDIRSLRSVDLTRDGIADLAIAVEGTIVVRGGAEAATIWESGLILASASEADSMYVADVEGNGIPDLLVNTGIGFVVFEGPQLPVFSDSFESGDTSAWSGSLP